MIHGVCAATWWQVPGEFTSQRPDLEDRQLLRWVDTYYLLLQRRP